MCWRGWNFSQVALTREHGDDLSDAAGGGHRARQKRGLDSPIFRASQKRRNSGPVVGRRAGFCCAGGQKFVITTAKILGIGIRDAGEYSFSRFSTPPKEPMKCTGAATARFSRRERKR